jgi:hypothetical protein
MPTNPRFDKNQAKPSIAIHRKASRKNYANVAASVA